MIGILILSHGQFADELLAAARTIAGELPPQFDSLSLDWNDGFAEAQAKIAEALERLDSGSGVLILTDMFGGTPCNVALTFMEPGKVEIVTGVNLPMVVRLGCLLKQDMDLTEVAYWLQEKGRRSVCVASDLKPPTPTLEASNAGATERPADSSSGEDGAGGRRRSELGAALAAAREGGR